MLILQQAWKKQLPSELSKVIMSLFQEKKFSISPSLNFSGEQGSYGIETNACLKRGQEHVYMKTDQGMQSVFFLSRHVLSSKLKYIRS